MDHGQTIPDPRPSPPPAVEPPSDGIQEESIKAPDEEKSTTQTAPENHIQEIKPLTNTNSPQPDPSGTTIETPR